MQAVFDQFKDHPRIKGFPYMEVISNGSNSLQQLRHCKAESDTWRTGTNFEETMDELWKIGQESQQRLSRCIQCRKDLNSVLISVKMSNKSRKRQWRGKRDTITKELKKSAIPGALAKQAADVIYAQSEDPSEVGIKTTVSEIPEYSSDLNATDEIGGHFNRIMAITAPAGWPDNFTPTHLHTEIGGWLAQNKTLFETKAAEVKSSLVRNATVHVGFTTVASDPGLTILNGADESFQNIFKFCAGVRTMVYQHECNNLEVSDQALPFAGLRMIITILTGTVLVIGVPHEQLKGVTLDRYLKDAPSGSLSMDQSTTVEADSSVYVPFGMVPIIFPFKTSEDKGAPIEAKKSKRALSQSTMEHSSYVINVFLDANADVKVGQAARQFAVTNMVRAQAALPNSFRTNEGVVEWRKTMEASLVPKDGTIRV